MVALAAVIGIIISILSVFLRRRGWRESSVRSAETEGDPCNLHSRQWTRTDIVVWTLTFSLGLGFIITKPSWEYVKCQEWLIVCLNMNARYKDACLRTHWKSYRTRICPQPDRKPRGAQLVVRYNCSIVAYAKTVWHNCVSNFFFLFFLFWSKRYKLNWAEPVGKLNRARELLHWHLDPKDR